MKTCRRASSDIYTQWVKAVRSRMSRIVERWGQVGACRLLMNLVTTAILITHLRRIPAASVTERYVSFQPAHAQTTIMRADRLASYSPPVDACEGLAQISETITISWPSATESPANHPSCGLSTAPNCSPFVLYMGQWKQSAHEIIVNLL